MSGFGDDGFGDFSAFEAAPSGAAAAAAPGGAFDDEPAEDFSDFDAQPAEDFSDFDAVAAAPQFDSGGACRVCGGGGRAGDSVSSAASAATQKLSRARALKASAPTAEIAGHYSMNGQPMGTNFDIRRAS